MIAINYQDDYGHMHRKSKTIFAGSSIFAHVNTIAGLVDEIRYPVKPTPLRLLDYGCGKGIQYRKHKIHEINWKVDLPFLYDIGVPDYREKPPKGVFDGVICTDMMEHIAPKHIEGILTEIFGGLKNDGSKQFAFFSICVRPAKKRFDRGVNAGKNLHLTIQPPEWWHDRISAFKIQNCRVIVHYS